MRLSPLCRPLLILALVAPRLVAQPAPSRVTVITGVTLIDGNGGAPVPDAVVIVTNDRITARGPRGSVAVPKDATVIDASGRFMVPGFFDTNVHLSLYGGVNDRYETLVRYNPRQAEIVLEAAQLQLKYGITTVRDSYGVLPALVETRERIARQPRAPLLLGLEHGPNVGLMNAHHVVGDFRTAGFAVDQAHLGDRLEHVFDLG